MQKAARDGIGRKVVKLVNARAGQYNAVFNARALSSEVYFYKLQAGNFVQTKKMMLVK